MCFHGTIPLHLCWQQGLALSILNFVTVFMKFVSISKEVAGDMY